MQRDTKPLRPTMESQRTEGTRGVHRLSNHPGLLGAMLSVRRRRVADDAGERATHAAPATNDGEETRGALALTIACLGGLVVVAAAGYFFGAAVGVTLAALAVIAALVWTQLVCASVDRGVVALPAPTETPTGMPRQIELAMVREFEAELRAQQSLPLVQRMELSVRNVEARTGRLLLMSEVLAGLDLVLTPRTDVTA